jgi:hypothetical protein
MNDVKTIEEIIRSDFVHKLGALLALCFFGIVRNALLVLQGRGQSRSS